MVYREDHDLLEILKRVKEGRTKPEEALGELRQSGFVDLGFAKVDLDRRRRVGTPEVILCHNKTPEQIINIARTLDSAGQNILCTRVNHETASKVKRQLPGLTHNPLGRALVKLNEAYPEAQGRVGIVAAGTSDLPVAEEAAVTAAFMGAEVKRFDDVGIAGLHRMIAYVPELKACDALVVVAGMEGALPSVIGGLISVPIIAVPTSAGYGASFEGLAAMLGMLNSCSPGVSVVNIDNGFGAAYQAAQISRRAARPVATRSMAAGSASTEPAKSSYQKS